MVTKNTAVKKQPARPVRKTVKPAPPKAAAAIAIPPLKKGENWAGIIMKDGKPHYHLIALAGHKDKANFDAAAAFAKKNGGEGPTLRDLGLLRINLRERFGDKIYWSCEESRYGSDWAWVQYFAIGAQDVFSKDKEFCAVAVRRVLIG